LDGPVRPAVTLSCLGNSYNAGREPGDENKLGKLEPAGL